MIRHPAAPQGAADEFGIAFGPAIDTVAFGVTNPGAAPAAGNVAANSGDSLAVRNYGAGPTALMTFLTRQGASAGFIEVRSPLMHDNARGLRFLVAETPAVMLLPQDTGQPLRPSDTLTVTISGGAAETDVGAIGIYYPDLPGMSAKLKDWNDIQSAVVNLKSVQVAMTTTAGGLWLDTVITTTENLLKADTWYAVLGYITDVAMNAVGIKSPETGNLRICGPGSTASLRTDDYFIRLDERHPQLPCIPVFNANNRAGVFVSTSAVAAAASNVTLMLAELQAGYQA